jgi:uncharacterized protein (DUF433 family)
MTHVEGMLKGRETFKDGQDNLKKTLADLFAVCPSIGLDKQRRGGIPTLGKTRFSFAQLLAELVEGNRNLAEICDHFDLDFQQAQHAIDELAVVLDSKFA